MKEIYTEESWERFKELNQKATKRLAIAETRAQNNEDDISELKPKVAKLEEFADNVNDMTTGLNLLKGTRDFRVATTKVDGAFPEDGFTINTSLEKDSDGFTVLYLPNDQSAYSSIIRNVKPGETYTVSFDIKFDAVPKTIDEALVTVFVRGDNSTTKTSVGVTLNRVGYTTVPNANEWVHCVYHYTVGQYSDAVHLGLTIRSGVSLGANSRYKKFSVLKGRINNPIWSPAPSDLAMEPINDLTIGNNLLRGTRDFIVGTNRFSTGSGTAIFYDGFTISSSYTSDKLNIIKNQNIPAIISLTPGGTVMNIPSSAITDVKAGDQLTFSCKVRLDSAVDNTGDGHIIIYTLDKSSAQLSSDGYTITTLGLTNAKVGEWNHIVIKYTVRDTFTDNNCICVYLRSSKNNISFTEPCMYKGKIERPEWSASPFDYASSELEAGTPKLLGSIPLNNRLRDIDLDDVTTPGTYSTNNVEPVTGNILNYPVNKTGTLDVIALLGSTPTSYLAQIYTTYELKTYVRTKFGASAQWSSWSRVYTYDPITPIEGGGTAGSNLTDARSNLKIDIPLGALASTFKDDYNEWHEKDSGLYSYGTSNILHGQLYQYGIIHNYKFGDDITQFLLKRAGSANASPTLGYRTTNLADSGKAMPSFKMVYSPQESPYIPGLYQAQSIAAKFALEIGSNKLANWLASRVSQGNFEGINIGDYVDITCSGVSRRFVIAAIDPYYDCGNSRMSHHLVMVHHGKWDLNASRDGDYAVSGSGTIRWNTTSNNNGTAAEGSPYLASNLHKWESEVVIKQFPQEWQDVMIDRWSMGEIRYSASSALSEANGFKWCNLGKIWSLSTVEMLGRAARTNSNFSSPSDTQFPIFTKMGIGVGMSDRSGFWLRDATPNSSTDVNFYNYQGFLSWAAANAGNCPPKPCFLIG